MKDPSHEPITVRLLDQAIEILIQLRDYGSSRHEIPTDAEQAADIASYDDASRAAQTVAEAEELREQRLREGVS